MVIVVGVLVALAVDDWRQSRTERALERHLLETMLVDCDETAADLLEAVASAQARMAAVSHLLAALGLQPATPTGDMPPAPRLEGTPLPTNRESDIANWLILTGYTQVFDPRTAAFDELMAAGTLSVIRDAGMRSQIVRHYAQLVDLQESNAVFREDGLALRDALESVGLAVGDWVSDDDVLSRLRRSERVLASLRRTYLRAQEQTLVYPRIVEFVESFRRVVEAALAEV